MACPWYHRTLLVVIPTCSSRENKFSGAKGMQKKVLAQQQGHHDGSWYDVNAGHLCLLYLHPLSDSAMTKTVQLKIICIWLWLHGGLFSEPRVRIFQLAWNAFYAKLRGSFSHFSCLLINWPISLSLSLSLFLTPSLTLPSFCLSHGTAINRNSNGWATPVPTREILRFLRETDRANRLRFAVKIISGWFLIIFSAEEHMHQFGITRHDFQTSQRLLLSVLILVIVGWEPCVCFVVYIFNNFGM